LQRNMDMAAMSVMFFMGVTFDRYFTTPFGQYLRFIRPIFTLPFRFDEEFEQFTHECNDADEPFKLFFAPCSEYFLTPLGLQCFALKPNARNTLLFEKHLPAPLLRKLADHDTRHRTAWDSENAMPLVSGKSYTLKVALTDKPLLWYNTQAPAHCELQSLYDQVVRMFELRTDTEFTFFPDTTENPFVTYGTKPGARCPMTTTLDDLPLKDKHRFTLAVSNSGPGAKAEKWLFTVLKVHAGDTPLLPVALRVSAELQACWE